MTQTNNYQQNEIKAHNVAIRTHNGNEVKTLVRAAWNFAHIALWSHCLFSWMEKEKAKTYIREYLLQQPEPEKAYYSFCQRVMLARDYVNKGPGRFIPLPSHWLDEKNANGFAGTAMWLEQMLVQRASLPLYRREWKALAEATLEMAIDPSEKNFKYWKFYFLERREGVLWQLFLSAITNLQFEN